MSEEHPGEASGYRGEFDPLTHKSLLLKTGPDSAHASKDKVVVLFAMKLGLEGNANARPHTRLQKTRHFNQKPCAIGEKFRSSMDILLKKTKNRRADE